MDPQLLRGLLFPLKIGLLRTVQEADGVLLLRLQGFCQKCFEDFYETVSRTGLTIVVGRTGFEPVTSYV